MVEYSLYDGFQSEEAPPAFHINPHDGQICVSQDLDRERDPATFDLLVKAKDGVSPSVRISNILNHSVHVRMSRVVNIN